MIKYIILLLFLFTANSFSEEWILKGYIPPDVTKSFLSREYKRLFKILNPNAPLDTSTITVIFYKQSEQKLLGIRLPEWGGGGALGRDSIVIPVDKSGAFFENNYLRILSHELVHISLTRMYGTVKIPRWFHEGIAMTLAAEISFDDQVSLSWAVLTNNIMDLNAIEQLNRFDQTRARIAYSISHFAAQFLVRTYGMDIIPELLDAVLKKHSFGSACITVFGLSPLEFNTIIHNKLISEYRFFFIFAEYPLFGIIIFILAITGFFLTKYRNKLRRNAMEIEELHTDVNEIIVVNEDDAGSEKKDGTQN